MTAVSRLGRIIVAMRTRKAEKTGSTAHPAASTSAHAPADTAGGPQAAAERMRRGVIDKLTRIDLDAPLGKSQGVRAFLEVVLTHQLGESLLLSPRFIEILGDVQATIEGNPKVHGELTQLLRELKP
jgi:hypothetical protein